MSSFFQLLIISISLAMDALSVSIAGGMKSQNAKLLHAIRVAGFFGIFQAIMPLVGWSIGEVLAGFVAAFAHWIAFLLLLVIGIKMIKEAAAVEGSNKNILNTKTLIILSIATSIDALIVGITLSLLNIPMLLSAFVIGIVTFIFCFFGYLFGNKLGTLFGKKVELVGGLTLIAIGLKILFDHYI